LQLDRGTANDVDFVMATERLAGYEQLVGRWDATQHRAALADGRHAYFVARRQSEAIGFAIVRDWSSPEQVAHIKRIAVCRPGLGQGRSFLAPLVKRIFTDTEAFRIWLGVFPDNIRARRSYEAVGFQAEGVARGNAFFGGAHRDELVMALLRPEWSGLYVSTSANRTQSEGVVMKAAVLGEKGVEVRDLGKPTPKPNEVLIRVRASSLNRADLLVALGHQHGSVGGVGARLGLECSGEVEAVGSDVRGVKPGDRVMASAPGGFAEYVVTDAGRVHRIPGNNMSYEQAACFPVALQTMHNAVVTAGRLKRGESMLMQGASAGVGLMGMQIGKLMGASLVIGTSTNPERRARLSEFGCDLPLDSSDPTWPEQVKKATGGKGVDLIVDLVSAPVANQNLEAASILGRIVNVGRLGGMKGEFDFDKHALKRIDYIGVTFRTRSAEEVREINRLMRADLWPAIEAGKLSLPIFKTFRLADIAEALALMRANRHFGKVVISVA
jgi:NADPH:quinone reductase-like Zn-dependent oxidoreductase/RimJ/RimL family protein N-acetyltransferase